MTATFDPDALAAQLSLEEAVSLTHGKDFWRLNGVERLGVASGLKLTDGPNGARCVFTLLSLFRRFSDFDPRPRSLTAARISLEALPCVLTLPPASPFLANPIPSKSACFPAGVCLAASFDQKTAFAVGKALAQECRSKSASVILGPTVNIHRSPLGGRNFEVRPFFLPSLWQP